MHLWTDYEGRTIAGAYTLGKLLRSEGRNGFFATSDSTGNSAVIRLTESHFDEEEVLKRWRHVADLHQHNLIEIERVGQTNFDGVALTYALMERNDANLEDVLKERPLTTAETMQVGKSVVAALSALHASGLVHEHIEPANVLAVGEVVKLRSDCVRECVADGEFTSAEACEDLRKRDIHDFGTLLLRCLTLERELSPKQHLPEPFQRLIPGAMDGTLGLPQLSTALNPPVFTPQAPASPTQPSYAGAGVAGAINGTNGANGSTGANGASGFQAAGARPGMEAAAGTVPALGSARENAPGSARTEARVPVRARAEELAEEPRAASKLMWIVSAIGALVVLLLGWHFLGSKPAATTPAASPGVTAAAPGVATSSASATGSPAVSAPAAGDLPIRSTRSAEAGRPAAAAAGTHGRTGWYVIAFTYNREDQAHAKAVHLSTNHLSMHPEVFSPSGHAPYFVSLGGPMSEDEARAVLSRARRSGLPRDTFIRRY